MRTVPIIDALRSELVRHKLATGRRARLRPHRQRPVLDDLDRPAREGCVESRGSRGPTLHTSRHATISRLIVAGVNPKAVQTYAGHSSITTTFDAYGHLFPSTIEADRERLEAHLRATIARRSHAEKAGRDGSRRV
jgi:integrase